MGSSSSKKQSKEAERVEEALESLNGSSSSRNSKTIRREFQEITRQRQPRSADNIKKEAFANTVGSKDRISSNTLYRQSESGVSPFVKPVESTVLKKPQYDVIGSRNSPSVYPSLNKESSFTSSRTSQVNNFTYYDTPGYNVKSNENTSNSFIPRNQLNSNSSHLQLETGGVNMKTETSYNSSCTSQLNNSSFSNLPESNVKFNKIIRLNSNIPKNHPSSNSLYHKPETGGSSGLKPVGSTRSCTTESLISSPKLQSQNVESVGSHRHYRHSTINPDRNMMNKTAHTSSQICSVPVENIRCDSNSRLKTESSKYDTNVKQSLCGLSHSTLSDNLSDIRTRDAEYSPCVLNNLSDPAKSNLNMTEKVAQSKVVNENSEIMLKHEAFLKRLVASYDLHSSRRNRGFYCSVCHFYKIYYGKLSNSSDFLKHDQTEVHKKAIVDKNDVKRYYCRQCKAHFFGDVLFWMDHVNMDLHKLFADKRNSRQISNDDENLESFSRSHKKNNGSDKPLNTIPSMSLFDYLSLQKDNDHCCISSDLILKKDIAKNFYKKLINDDKGNYSFYCHACEMWTDNNDVWRNHNGIHEKDLKFKNTLKNCISCRVIIVGDDKLKQFHFNDEEHESFKMLLAGEINKGKSLNDNDSSDSDDSEDEGEDNTRKNDKNLTALLIKGLMNDTNRNDVFHSMKQYGNVDKIYMHYNGPTSAKVIFKFRYIARNLVNNGVPIFIQGSKIEISLTEL